MVCRLVRAEALFSVRTAGAGDTRAVSSQRGWYVGEHAVECNSLNGGRANVVKDHVPVVKSVLQCMAMLESGALCMVCGLLLGVGDVGCAWERDGCQCGVWFGCEACTYGCPIGGDFVASGCFFVGAVRAVCA